MIASDGVKGDGFKVRAIVNIFKRLLKARVVFGAVDARSIEVVTKHHDKFGLERLGDVLHACCVRILSSVIIPPISNGEEIQIGCSQPYEGNKDQNAHYLARHTD
jgi:hypothetical protein